MGLLKMRKLKTNDQVILIAGKDKGKKGVIKSINDEKLIVSGLNLIKKHVKPNPQLGVSGGIVEREALISVSNVALYNQKTQKADRVGFDVRDGKKVRIFKSTGEVIDV
jgi:large subunit ribosomal protein L24